MPSRAPAPRCEGWCKAAAAAAYLGVSVSTVKRFVRAGRLEARKQNGIWWVSEQSVEDLMHERARWVSQETAARLVGVPLSTLRGAVVRGQLVPRVAHHALPSLN